MDNVPQMINEMSSVDGLIHINIVKISEQNYYSQVRNRVFYKLFSRLKPIFHQKTGWRRVKFASPTNEMYMPNAKTQRQDPTPPIFHWLASGFGVGANANFRFGVGSLASGNANFHILDTNMLVSPTQKSGVGGIAQRQPPTPGILRSGGI